MSKRLILLWMLLGAMLFPVALRAQVVVEKSTEIVTISNKQYYMHHVKPGETLYGLAKAYQVTEEEIRKLNPEINELGLQADMVIGIPVNTGEVEECGNGYIVYTVQEAERTSRLLRRLEVSEEEFRRLNPSVGSNVFVGQKILIPTDEVAEQKPQGQRIDSIANQVQGRQQGDTIVEEELVAVEPAFVLPEQRPDECYRSSQNAYRHYRVALLVPLYLDDVDKIDTSKEKAEKSKNSRAMKFLQFYEGFMMAADSLTGSCGMRLDLLVMDVHENVVSAQAAVNRLQVEPVDLIVGPFFSKSFAVVEEYALQHNIPVVNPMSERESIIVEAPNVIKLKPSAQGMVTQLVDLVATNYSKAKVSLISDDNSDDQELVAAMEQALDSVVVRDVMISNAEMVELIVKESARRNMGKRVLSTMEAEGQIFSTKALQENPEGMIYFDNHFQRYSSKELDEVIAGLSSARDNVLIVYGKDIVYTTKILNTVNKSAQRYPITLVGLPSWSEFDNLLVPNLLNMNAIYFDDYFVDYNDSTVLKFVDDFRVKYESEPSDYAFEGFDVGWYFMNALIHYGPQMMGCLPYEHLPLMHTGYYFTKKRYHDGLENRYWNIYQYDQNAIELKRVLIYQEEE